MPVTGEIKAAQDALGDLFDLLGSSGDVARDATPPAAAQPKASPEVKNNSGSITKTFTDDGGGADTSPRAPVAAKADDAGLDALMDLVGGTGSGNRVMPAVAPKPKPVVPDSAPRVFRPANPPRGRPVSSGGG